MSIERLVSLTLIDGSGCRVEILVGLFRSLVMGNHRKYEEEYEVFTRVTIVMVTAAISFVLTSLVWAYFGSCN
jgi:hypothetical protein